MDHYYWYYGSYALYQMGPPHWDRWAKKLTPAVVKKQRQDGNFKGSWDPEGAWGDQGGRVGTTALAILTLQSEYRYAPKRVMKRSAKKPGKKPAPKKAPPKKGKKPH